MKFTKTPQLETLNFGNPASTDGTARQRMAAPEFEITTEPPRKKTRQFSCSLCRFYMEDFSFEDTFFVFC